MQQLSNGYTNILRNSRKKLFQVLFLKNDKARSVYVDEAETVNLKDIMEHLQRGESVFITSRKEERVNTMPDAPSLQQPMQTRGIARAFPRTH
jgi:hypothetical protein